MARVAIMIAAAFAPPPKAEANGNALSAVPKAFPNAILTNIQNMKQGGFHKDFWRVFLILFISFSSI